MGDFSATKPKTTEDSDIFSIIGSRGKLNILLRVYLCSFDMLQECRKEWLYLNAKYPKVVNRHGE